MMELENVIGARMQSECRAVVRASTVEMKT